MELHALTLAANSYALLTIPKIPYPPRRYKQLGENVCPLAFRVALMIVLLNYFKLFPSISTNFQLLNLIHLECSSKCNDIIVTSLPRNNTVLVVHPVKILNLIGQSN